MRGGNDAHTLLHSVSVLFLGEWKFNSLIFISFPKYFNNIFALMQLSNIFVSLVLIQSRFFRHVMKKTFYIGLIYFYYHYYYFHDTTAPRRQRPPHCRGFTITLRHTTLGRTPLGEWSPDAGTSTWQHTTLTTDKHPYPRRDSNPQSQQASGHRLTSLTARPLGSTIIIIIIIIIIDTVLWMESRIWK